MDAHRANAPRRLVEKEIYGEVEYFIVHEYNGSESGTRKIFESNFSKEIERF